MNIKDIKIGTKIKWYARSGNRYNLKSGNIVRIITCKDELSAIEIAKKEFPNHKVKFRGDGKEKNISFLIEVVYGGNAKPRLFHPCIKNLKASDYGIHEWSHKILNNAFNRMK